MAATNKPSDPMKDPDGYAKRLCCQFLPDRETGGKACQQGKPSHGEVGKNEGDDRHWIIAGQPLYFAKTQGIGIRV